MSLNLCFRFNVNLCLFFLLCSFVVVVFKKNNITTDEPLNRPPIIIGRLNKDRDQKVQSDAAELTQPSSALSVLFLSFCLPVFTFFYIVSLGRLRTQESFVKAVLVFNSRLGCVHAKPVLRRLCEPLYSRV